MSPIAVKIGVEQRLFPAYRKPFFEMLAKDCPLGFNLFAGEPLKMEGILQADGLDEGTWLKADTRYIVIGKQIFYRQRNLLAWLKGWKPEVLIMEANPRHLGIMEAIDWMHAQGGKVIGWGLGAGSSQGLLARVSNPRRMKMVNRFDALISYSQLGKQDFCKDGVDPEKIFVAANAVVPKPSKLLTQKPLGSSRAKVLFVGRLLARKQVDRLIRACAGLPSEIAPDLVIVGNGDERGNLEKLAGVIYPSTQFRGDLRGRELDAQYQAADLFVLPGTGGLAVQQAMSHGLPVITGVGDGTQMDLVRPENGWQLQNDEVDTLKVALTGALSDRKHLREMGKASFEIVRNEVNLEAMLKVFEDAIHFVLADPGGHAQ